MQHKAQIVRVRKPIEMVLTKDVLKLWDGEVVINKKNEITGQWEELKFHNHVLLGGLQYLAKLLYRIEPQVAVSTFETDLYAGSSGDESSHITPDESDTLPFVQGYNLVCDAAQGDGVIPYPRHKIGYDFDHLIPFRMIPESENDFATYRNMYLHHRIIELDGIRYVQYFTKKANITYKAKLDDDSEIPQNPNDNLTTNKDSRLVASFNITLDDDELVEWFRLTKQGGAQSTSYNGVLTMIGSKATWDDPASDATYPTMTNSVVFSRCNHMNIYKSVQGDILCKYMIAHI